MADNTAIKNASGSSINAATDELADSSFSPKVSLLLGDASVTPIAPAISVADDAAFTPGTTRVNPAGFFADESATDSVDEGDIGIARMTLDRRIHTAAAGDVAHDGVDAGSPVKVGGQAITALPTAVSNADRTNFVADKFGRQIAIPVTVRDLVGTQATTISASTAETTIVTAAASTFNDLIMLIVSNTSASTNTRIDFRDDTGGSVLFSLQVNGGQPPVGFALPVPIPQTAVNKNWTAQCSASTIDIRIYAVFAKNK